MGDTVLYATAVSVPLLLSGCLVAFIKRRRRSRAPARWPHVLLGNALASLLLLSIVFLVGESYYRYYYDATDSYSQTRSSALWFERHFERNNASVRDSIDYLFPRRSNRPRITFVGDSFTAGHGIANVEDRFANRVRNAKRGAWEVHVFADVGRDTGEELKLLPDLAQQRYDFDTVVLVYCLNDLSDLLAPHRTIAERSARESTRPGFLVEHSFFINTYYYRLKVRFDPLVAGYYDYVLAAYDGPAWNEQQARLCEFRDRCQEFGGRLRLVIFPFMHSLGPNNPYRTVHERLGQFWDALEVPWLDLLPVLEPHARDGLMVNRYDAHPNERAHAIAADAIVEFLERQL